MPPEEDKSEGTPEVDRDVRVDESWKANLKLLFDTTVQNINSVQSQLQKDIASINAATQQGINHLVENANLATKQFLTNNDLITKQCIRHNDIAVDCIWDPGPGEESLKPDAKK